MTILRYIICITLLLVVFVFNVSNWGDWHDCWFILSLVFKWTDFAVIFGGTVVLSFLFSSPKKLWRSLILSWTEKAVRPDELREAHNTFRIVERNALFMGVLTFVVRFVILMLNFNRPEVISPMICSAIFSLFYGILLAEVVVRPIDNGIIKRMSRPIAAEGSWGSVSETSLIIIVSVMGPLAFIAILNFCMMAH